MRTFGIRHALLLVSVGFPLVSRHASAQQRDLGSLQARSTPAWARDGVI